MSESGHYDDEEDRVHDENRRNDRPAVSKPARWSHMNRPLSSSKDHCLPPQSIANDERKKKNKH